MQMKLIKEEDIRDYLGKWIRILGLENWDIRAHVVRAEKMTLDGCAGENNYNEMARQSLIHLRDPMDWPEGEFEIDMEKTLVHELLHLTFSLLDTKDKLKSTIMHRVLNDVAVALIRADRENLITAIPEFLTDDYGRPFMKGGVGK